MLVRHQCVLRPSHAPLDSEFIQKADKEGLLLPKSLNVTKKSRCANISLSTHSCKKNNNDNNMN